MGLVHSSWEALIVGLKVEEVIVSTKYSDFANVFFFDSAAKLPKHFGINNHLIDLKKGKKPPYMPIYSLEPVDLKTLKIYIETNLASGFI